MKHLKLFGNANELQTYVDGTEYLEPFVGTDSQGGGVKYNRVVENIIRLFVNGPFVIINKYLDDNDGMNNEPVNLEAGWNSLDMTNDFKYGFGLTNDSIIYPLSEVEFSHYTGTKIYPNMFCFTQIREVVLGKNTKIIGHSAFENCQNLSKCVLPEGLKEIQDRAFVNTSIGRLILPKSIEKLGKDVCSIHIKYMYEEWPIVRFQSLEPPVLDIESFRQGTTLEVPMSAVETYKNLNIPGWKEKFGNNIVGY